jgi:hypothetical protein
MLEFILANWKWLLGAAASVALAIALFFARADAAKWKAADEKHVAAWQLEQAKHAITRQSLVTALASIDEQNRAIQKLGSEGRARQDAAAKALSDAQAAAQRNVGLVRQLETSASQKRLASDCKASAAYIAAKGEL